MNEMLGVGFYIDIMSLPKNVGEVGDEGVWGHTALISSDLSSPLDFYRGNDELLANVSIRICNEVTSVCRVLYDITLGGGKAEIELLIGVNS